MSIYPNTSYHLRTNSAAKQSTKQSNAEDKSQAFPSERTSKISATTNRCNILSETTPEPPSFTPPNRISQVSVPSPLNPRHANMSNVSSTEEIVINPDEYKQKMYVHRVSRNDSASNLINKSLTFRAITNSATNHGFPPPPPTVNLDKLEFNEGETIAESLGVREIVRTVGDDNVEENFYLA